MKILIVGYGNIAFRHIKNIKSLLPNSKIKVLRQQSKEAVRNGIGSLIIETLFDIDKAINWNPEVVFITSPAPTHIKNAIKFAEIGSHLYIEKPLSDSLLGINELEKIVTEKEISAIVGYHLRYHNGIRKLKESIDNNVIGNMYSVKVEVGQWLPSWRPGKDYRNTVSARKELGGGAILELSHEIDYLRFLLGEVSAVFCMATMQSKLEINAEDNAEIILKFDNNIIANLHIDLLRHDTTRSITILGEKGTLRLDLISCCLKMFSSETKKWEQVYYPTEFDNNEAYLTCLRSFIESIKDKKNTAIPITEGLKTLRVALAAKKSNSKSKTIYL